MTVARNDINNISLSRDKDDLNHFTMWLTIHKNNSQQQEGGKINEDVAEELIYEPFIVVIMVCGGCHCFNSLPRFWTAQT